MPKPILAISFFVILAAGSSRGATAQTPSAPPPAATPAKPAAAPVPTASLGYVIGPEDVLSINFWREKDLSTDVIVRPDGRITLPLLNEFEAAGLTPEALREKIAAAADKYIQDPNITIIVKQINSRRVYITGNVNKPGSYNLMAPTTIVQLISMAGGLQDYADKKNIVVMRTENGRPASYRFNYKEVIERKNLNQNIELKPGDTVIVP